MHYLIVFIMMFSIIAQVSNVSRQNAQHSPVSGW